MPGASSLWWPLLWRFTLAIVVLSYVIAWTSQFVVPLDENWIKIRPTVGWFALAAIFWVAGAASTRFLSTVLWGDRLALSASQWLAVSTGVSLFFALLAVLNWVVAYFASTDTWLNFKLFAPYPLFIAFLIALSRRLHTSRNAA